MKKMLTFITVLTCFAIANSTAFAKYKDIPQNQEQITKDVAIQTLKRKIKTYEEELRKMKRELRNMKRK